EVDSFLRAAHTELSNPKYELGTKHIIFISDGDVQFPQRQTLAMLGQAGITLTTVCITSHGDGEIRHMELMAKAVVTPQGKRGNSYHVKDPTKLPSIYLKETRLVSQSYIQEKKFDPIARKSGPGGMPKQPPPLHGFVRTSRRE